MMLLIRFITALVVACVALNAQGMYGNSTLGTFYSFSADGKTLHVWGVTYVPATTATHTYQVTTTLRAPDGTTRSSSGSGSGSYGAQADIYYNVPGSGPEGDFTISSTHYAYCPYYNLSGGYFINGAITSILSISIAITSTVTSGSGIAGADGICPQTTSCTNTNRPRCPVRGVYEGPGRTCYIYYFTYLLAVKNSDTGIHECSDVGFSIPAGPGYCTPWP